MITIQLLALKFSDWNKNTNEIKGSWWIDWDQWLSKNNGKLILDKRNTATKIIK